MEKSIKMKKYIDLEEFSKNIKKISECYLKAQKGVQRFIATNFYNKINLN